MKDFGILFKTLRKNAAFTQKEIADKLGIDSTNISKWETGKTLPDISIIPQIANILNVSCDDLLHPAETLQKINNVADDSTSLECDDATPVYDNSQETKPNANPMVIMQKRTLFTPKRILLACILVMVLVVSIFVYTYTHADFKFIEARTNVETQYGPAYELVYCHKTKHPTHVFIEHADSLLENWKNDTYTDSAENVLIVTYYLPNANINNWEDAYFQMYYFPDAPK